MRLLILSLTAAGVLLAGCGNVSMGNKGGGESADIDQSRLCQVDTWKPLAVADQCQPGQKILFRPNGGSGSAENAALFAAANCDLRFTVAVTPGGTTCIYKPIQSANALPDNASASDS